MARSLQAGGQAPDKGIAEEWGAALVEAARAAGPPLLFGLRLWASVCLALYVAFWLQLDNAYWAGTSAALVCQPRLGASLRKGWFRMVGTVIGAVAIVVLTAVFPQNRVGFLVGLALWGAICTFVASLVRNFGSYAAALAGYTAAIIAGDELGASGGANGQAFSIAVIRVSEIWIGIVCAGIVLAGTDFGHAPRRLAALFAKLYAEIAGGFATTLKLAGSALSDMQPARRELARQVIALDPVIDEAIGKSSSLRYHSLVLEGAVGGLIAALADWRSITARLIRLPDDEARRQADAVLDKLPENLKFAADQASATPWLADPIGMRRHMEAVRRNLADMQADTPSLRLVADKTADVLASLGQVLDGLALLVAARRRSEARDVWMKLRVADWLPAYVNAGRAFVTICAVELFWILTAWPNGAQAITFAAVSVFLFAPQADEAYARAVGFSVGVGIGAVFAGIIAFAGLPSVETFAGFSIVMGLFLVPAGILMAQPWRASMFAAMVGNFLPILAPANQMTYNTTQFYNTALAIVGGCGVAALSFRLLPSLSPALRARRLTALTLRDLRRLARNPEKRRRDNWEGRMHARLAALPNQAEPLQRAQLLTALSVGAEMIALRSVGLPGLEPGLISAFDAIARGNSDAAIARFSALDRRLAMLDEIRSGLDLRERSRILVICDALARHREFFDAGARP